MVNFPRTRGFGEVFENEKEEKKKKKRPDQNKAAIEIYQEAPLIKESS